MLCLARALAVAGVVLLRPTAAQETAPAAPADWPQLTGGWGGARDRLRDAGVELEAFYTLDLMHNARGGSDRGTALLGDVDLLLSAELAPLVGWRGARAFAYGLATHGDSISALVGDLQAVDNIEAPAGVRLFEAWLEQDLAGGDASLLVGLYDVNGEFDATVTGALFVNSSFGMGADLGNSGRNGPSTFPATSLAARLQVHPQEHYYARAVVADGVPGDPARPGDTVVRLDRDDGLLLVAEVGVLNLPGPEVRSRVRRRTQELPPEQRDYGGFGKYAVGAWGYTDGLASDGDRRGGGVYALAEQSVYYEPDDPAQGLAVFGRAGICDDDASPFQAYVGGGLVYRGLVQDRNDDRIGLGVAAARLGDELRSGLAPGRSRWEVAIELTWRVPVTDWLSLQPDLQYVIAPAGADVDDAWVVGIRGILSL